MHDVEPMQPKLIATTDKDGKFSFKPPIVVNASDESANWSYREHIVVVANDHGFATTQVATLRNQMRKPDSFLGVVAQTLFAGANSARIELPAVGESLRGRIINIDGQPVVGATVRIRNCSDAADNGFRRPGSPVPVTPAGIWQPRVNHLLDTIEPVCQRFVLPSAVTNARGEFELTDVGPDKVFQLLIEGAGIQSADVIARNSVSAKI